MRIVIIGGGKLGAELAARMLEKSDGVIVIETDEERARSLSDLSRALVLTGDGTDMRRLQSIDLRPTDVFVAVTGADEDNLVACQLASSAFGVRRVLARMNDPRNRQSFMALGVPTVNVTDEMTAMIERSLELADHVARALPERGQLVPADFTVGDDFEPRPVRELGLPPSTILVTISRDDTVTVPDGGTEILPGDRLLFITHEGSVDTVGSLLLRDGTHG